MQFQAIYYLDSSTRKHLFKQVILKDKVRHRAYRTTGTYSAFDHGVTLFDAAEAYGPLDVELILGETLVFIRNNVAIETKFGWNIDPETG